MKLNVTFKIYRNLILRLFLAMPIFSIIIASCQETKLQPSLIFHNQSSHVIDSVIIPCYKSKYEESRACSYNLKEKIYPEKSKAVMIDKSNYKVSPFDIDFFATIYIYINGKKIVTSWVPAPYENSKEVENIYITDKGAYPFNPKVEPEDLRMTIRDSSVSNKIDSISINETILKSRIVGNNWYYFDLKYKAFKAAPFIKIYRNGKPVEIRIEYDWDNWIENFNPEYIIYDSGMVRKKD